MAACGHEEGNVHNGDWVTFSLATGNAVFAARDVQDTDRAGPLVDARSQSGLPRQACWWERSRNIRQTHERLFKESLWGMPIIVVGMYGASYVNFSILYKYGQINMSVW